MGCEAWVCPWGPTVAPRYQQAGKSGKAQAQSQAAHPSAQVTCGGTPTRVSPSARAPLGADCRERRRGWQPRLGPILAGPACIHPDAEGEAQAAERPGISDGTNSGSPQRRGRTRTLMGLACQSNRAKSRLVQAHDINSCAARRKSAAGLAPTALPPQAFSLLPRNTRPVSFCPRHPRPHRRRIR